MNFVLMIVAPTSAPDEKSFKTWAESVVPVLPFNYYYRRWIVICYRICYGRYVNCFRSCCSWALWAAAPSALGRRQPMGMATRDVTASLAAAAVALL